MSRYVDQQRSDDARYQRVEKAKQRLRDQQAIIAFEVEQLDGGPVVTVAEQARRLKRSQQYVRWLQRVLGFRNGRIKTGWLATRVGETSAGMEASP